MSRAGGSPRPAIPGLRWWIVGLLVAAHILNYLDRQAFALMSPQLQHDIGWSEQDYGWIITAFQLVYAVSSLAGGALVDRLGARIGVALSLGWWSLAQLAHATARSAFGFGAGRAGLAAGEATGYAGLLKGMTEWFPGRERATAAGIVFASVQFGAIAGPIIVPLAADALGWRGVFILTGVAGLVLLAPWLVLYQSPDRHRRLSDDERAEITAGRDPVERRPPSWPVLLRTRQVWAYVLALALVNPGWWFISYWLPKFLAAAHHVQGKAAIPYLVVVYSMAAFGSITGGLWSSALVRRGWDPVRARKAMMLAVAVVMPVVVVAGFTHSVWLAVGLVGLAAIGHQCWTANITALLGDLVPVRAIGAVVGIGNFTASILGAVSSAATGWALGLRPAFYLPMFAFVALIYGVTFVCVHLLTRRGGAAVFDDAIPAGAPA